MTRIWTDIDPAAEALLAGRLVAFPTETVYGLGGDALNDRAVAGIYEAKGRPTFNPLILHVPDLDAAERIGVFTEPMRHLAALFWPGPLTLVTPLHAEAGVAPLASAGLATIALRAPAHSLARDLMQAVGRPLAAPSANPSSKVSPTTAGHVMDGLFGRIAGVLDGGPCPVGLESTIVGFDGETPVLLRPGGVAEENLAAALGRPLTAHDGGINAPGQMTSHYAPDAPIRLNAEAPSAGEAYVGFGSSPKGDLNLSPSGDLAEAAANLFAMLREIDQSSRPIAIAPIPDHGLGHAINDRLRRAAAPRT